MPPFAALVLAGTRPGGDPFAIGQGVLHKGLIEVGGRPIVERVIAAVIAAGAGRVLVSTDDEAVGVIARRTGAETLPTATGPSESTALGLEAAGAPLLVTTSDHALLQPEWVRALIEGTPPGADLSIMLARRTDVERAMPGGKRTYLRFADGEWSGCNLFYLQTARARSAIDAWRSVEADRKRPWRIAAKLGPATLLSMVLGRLTLAEGIARLGNRIGIEAALVPAPDGLAAVDVDKEADLIAVRALLEARGAEWP